MRHPRSSDYEQRCADLLRSIAIEQPELLRAADEVDGTLSDWMLTLTPLERLDVVRNMGAFRELGANATRRR